MMNRTFLLGLLFCAVSFPALAQSVPVTPVTRDKLPPEGYKNSIPVVVAPPEAKPTDMQTAAMLCQTTRLMSDRDSAEYKAGVDAYGRAVAPADSSTQTFQMPDRVDIPVNIDILKTVGAITTPTPDLATNVGTVSVLKSGQIQFNGHDVTNNINAFCEGHPLPTTPPPLLPQAQPKEGQ